MNKLTDFLDMLCGHFDNSAQLKQLNDAGISGYPHAEHINTIINDKITSLPEGFNKTFVLEESYYEVDKKINPMPHLFLISEEDGRIRLDSYEMPEGYTKETFSYDNLSDLSFLELKRSEKFNPIYYNYHNGIFRGRSESMFSPVLKFTLDEEFSKVVLKVSEIFEANGKRTFGYDLPLEYRRLYIYG